MFYIRTALIVFEALVALYFGFFDLSLSLVGILLGIVMMMNPNSTRLRQYYNAVLMITLGYLTVYLSSFGKWMFI